MALKKLPAANVKYIAIHCSATPPSMDIGVSEIDRWHRDNGFLKIGYHYVIRRDGTLEVGRQLDEVGAHVQDFNHCSIGVCLVGGVDPKMKPQDNFTPAQFETLRQTVLGLTTLFQHAVVQGHRDFPNVAKACPSFPAKDWWAKVSS